jgi:hypothetical protein
MQARDNASLCPELRVVQRLYRMHHSRNKVRDFPRPSETRSDSLCAGPRSRPHKLELEGRWAACAAQNGWGPNRGVEDTVAGLRVHNLAHVWRASGEPGGMTPSLPARSRRDAPMSGRG